MHPESFETSLKNYDPLLSLRWGRYMGEWVIERKRVKPTPPALMRLGKRCADKLESYPKEMLGLDDTQMNQVVKYAEEYLSGRNGKLIVFFTKGLDATVINKLWSLDMQRHGLRKFAADEERRDYLKQKQEDSMIEDAAREAADAIKFVNKRNPTTAQEVDALMAQTGDMAPARAKTPKSILDATGTPVRPAEKKGKTLLGMDGKPLTTTVPSEFQQKLIDAGA